MRRSRPGGASGMPWSKPARRTASRRRHAGARRRAHRAGLLLIEVDSFLAPCADRTQKSSPAGARARLDRRHRQGTLHTGRRARRRAEKRRPGVAVHRPNRRWDSLEKLYADIGLPPRLPSQACARASRSTIAAATSSSLRDQRRLVAALSVTWPWRISIRAAPERKSHGGHVEHPRKQAQAHVTPLPFFNPERKRA